MHAVLLDEGRLYKSFDEILRSETMHTLPLITYTEPQAATFNLLNQNVRSNSFYDHFIWI